MFPLSSEQMAKEMVGQADVDGDGLISFDEFRLLVRQSFRRLGSIDEAVDEG